MKKLILTAATITATVVLLGLLMGYWMENRRVSSISKEIEDLSIQNNDALLQMAYFETFQTKENFCESVVPTTIDLLRNAIDKGMKLERYETINRLAPGYILEKKKYATILLRLWFNVIQLREICDENYSTIIYLYNHDPINGAEKTRQDIQSRALLELEHVCGKEKILLFALPSDLELTTITLLKKQYNITQVPSIIINEKYVFKGITNYNEIIPYTNCDLNG